MAVWPVSAKHASHSRFPVTNILRLLMTQLTDFWFYIILHFKLVPQRKVSQRQGHNVFDKPWQSNAAWWTLLWTGRTSWCHTVRKKLSPLNFVLSIAPQSGFKLQAPRLHLFHKTTHRTVDLQRNKNKTLPGSPLWHFQVFTVVTFIKGKQQIEPLPVSASHRETIF